MDSSSDDEGVITHRKPTSKRIFESDDEDGTETQEIQAEATEDFKLHLSDEEGESSMHVEAFSDSKRNIDGKELINDSDSDGGISDKSSTKLSPDRTVLTGSNLNRSVSPTVSKIDEYSKQITYPGREDIMKKLSALADSDSDSDVDGDLEEQANNGTKSSNQDQDSSSDSDSRSVLSEINLKSTGKESGDAGKSSKSKLKEKASSERKSKTKAKDAMLEIKTESQRQLRQSSINLPYHVPKQRSLLDFLNRRRSVPSMPIKGPPEKLAEVWKEIEAREKEVEEFYKSESEGDSDDDTENCALPEPEKLDLPDVEVHKNMSCAIETVLETEPKQSDENDVEPDTPLSLDKMNDNPALELVKEDTEKTSEEHTDKKTKSSPQCIPSAKIELGMSLTAGDGKNEGSNSIAQSHLILVPKSISASAESDLTSFSNSVSEPPCPLLNENNESKTNSKCDDNHSNCKAAFGASPIWVDKSTVEKNPCSQAGEIVKVTTNPSNGTQDSQDISLHFSEVCQTEGISQDKEVLTCDKPKETGPKPENAAKSVAQSPEKEAASAKRSLTWEDFKATMTFSDDEFESEDFKPKQVNLNKAPTTGSRLSLKGNPNDVIDLDDMNSNQTRTPGVQGLIERFLKHSATKKKPSTPQTVELSLISSEKDSAGDVLEIKHESLKISLSGNDSVNTDNPKPGARLKLLKDELHRQMRKQKEQEWQKKHEEMKKDQTYKGEKDECDMLPEDDEEEEEELTESEAESEPEIDDVREPKKKRKPKSMFVDEEAEVEDDDGVESIDEKEESDNENDDHGGDDGEDSDDIDEDKEELDEEPIKSNENKETTSRGQLKRSGTAADLFSSQSTEWHVDDDDDDFIPAGQPNGVVQHETSMDKIDDGKDCSIVFSPMSLSIPGKNPSFMESNSEETPSKFSWARGVKSQDGLKRLFNEPDLTSTQEKMDELAALFSDKFQDSQNDIAKLANTGSTADSEADLMALCSGKFMTQLPHPEDLEEGCSPTLSQTQNLAPSSKQAIGDEDSQDFSLTWNDGVILDKDCTNLSEDSKPKNKRFELEIMSSDDEQDFAQLQEKKKKKHKKLDFSDDEEDEVLNNHSDNDDDQKMEEENSNSNEDINDGGGKELFSVFQKPSKEVFYDSDENEIEPADFLEKEAELSEEEDWQGSEDEDEKGLDQLEMDEADKEDIDEDLVREQLVKNQMQKMLDEDRRDVRILQEMLLEDGELHSDTGGRERQFRWRNVDSSGMGDDGQGSDEEHADHEEEEDDAEWRKQRHEREMFLKEQREKQNKEEGNCGEEDDILENSELLKLGKAVLCKSRSNSQDLSIPKETVAVKPSLSNQLLSPDGKRPNLFLMKRGSFLSRGENVLAKLAKMTGSAKENVLVGAKSSGNFVFAAVSPPKREVIVEEGQESKTSKRKASLPVSKPQEKKPCLSTPSRQSSGLFDHL